MNSCYLALGSNQNNPERQLRQALRAIKQLPKTTVLKASSFHWTKAWGLSAQQDFCNAVVLIHTQLSPLVLLKLCQAIENQQGRVRKRRWGPRTLDIDIILYGQRKMRSKELTLPHPYFLERDFVMSPLCEIYPIENPLARHYLQNVDTAHKARYVGNELYVEIA